MAELFVGPIMDKIINTCFEYLQDDLSSQTSLKELEKRLRENRPKIQAVVSFASQANIKDQEDIALNKWIWQLRDAIDEADDLLDEFVYMQHEEELAKNKETRKVRSFSTFLWESASKIRKVGKGVRKNDSNLKRLEEVVQKLDKISGEVSSFLYLLKDAQQVQQVQDHELLKARTEGSFPKSILIGRPKEKEYIKQWLLRKPDETDITTNNLYSNISLLSIVGHGGMGKTSLLQHVYHQDEITKEFDLKIWVCVSNNFDIQKVIADMLESSQANRPSLENINTLQERLKSKVMSKKFLLVLDDIWEKEWDINKWETVLAPLAHGSLGSKILITTRMDCVAKMISEVTEKKMEKLTLEGLEEEKCLQLLNTHAFAGVKNRDDHKKLEFIAGELVKKLFGSPLAAKVIGGVLNKNFDERHWTNVLKKSALGRNEILPILKLSYTFLPKELRNCFTFCSIFPQDYHFNKYDLPPMWIAVGFIQSSDIQDGEDLEDVGQRYFDLLVQKSFFDKVGDNGYYEYYKMHDLLHEVARSISAQECFRFEEGDQKLFTEVPETIRHLFVNTSNVEVLKNLGKFKNLRTLGITNRVNIEYFDDMLTEIFKKSRNIRLLYIATYNPKLMHETIGYLKHLRYLRLDFSNLTQFPIPLCNLYHLQYIINEYCSPYFRDDFFSRDMSNLSNLRHINMDLLKFPGIGRLKFLQELHDFCVKNEIGYRIGELEHMNDLRILDINFLENVRDAEEAGNAKLCDKRKLAYLSLNWGDLDKQYLERQMRRNIADPDLDERVLDNLRPHHDLKKLKIFDYMGVRSAIWMNEAVSIKNLEVIEINRCLEWQNLPPFGQLLFLRLLSLQNMPKAKRFDGGVKAEDGCLFPCLTYLSLEDCPNLQELPDLPPKLKHLEITNIGWKTLNCYSISKSIPLKTLQVRHCSNITYIFLAGETGRVKIEDCPNLIYIGGHEQVETIGNIPASVESLQCLPSSLSTISFLKDLSLKSIPLLKSLSDLSPSLNSLYLDKLDNLDCLPLCLPTLSSLTKLEIIEVPKLRELPDLPPSLQLLRLYNLDNLVCLPSCLPTLSSLSQLYIGKAPKLRDLPDLPPTLYLLSLGELDNLDCLPSCLPTLSSLTDLSIIEIPKLRELPALPPSICELNLYNLDNLDCLPSCLPTLSSLTELEIIEVPKFRELPDLPPSLFELHLKNLNNLACLPSCLPTLSSLRDLSICKVPKLRELPDLPPSSFELHLKNLDNLDCLPSCLPTLSSLTKLHISEVPKLRELLDLPPSLSILDLKNLDNLDCLPSCLPTLSSLTELHIIEVPKLRELPDLPPSLSILDLENLDNLDCLPSCLPTLSSFGWLSIKEVPKLRELPDLPPSLKSLRLNNLDNLDCLPSFLSTLSSIKYLHIDEVPKLQKLPDLPPSLNSLDLYKLDNLDCLPSCLPTLSSLQTLGIKKVPKLRELPDLPPSLSSLYLKNLDNLDCLPSCLPTLSSLRYLTIIEVPKLRELPNLPPSLIYKEVKLRGLS